MAKAKAKIAVVDQYKPLQLWVKLTLAVLFIAYASVFLARQINFVTADLGRHITNGRVFVETGKIISTNYYSYTEPDFPAINHHWGSGVIFYFVHQHFGFKGLSVFYVLTILGAALFFIAAAQRFADARLVFFFSVLVVPLLAYRTEVRPEGVSLFFVGLFFYLLVLFKSLTPGPSPKESGARQDNRKPVYIIISLGIAQLIWVNCHIFFFMGFMLTGFFLIDEFLNRKDKEKLKQYIVLLGVLVVASLINPFFIEGFLAPFTIFNEYGYMIAENQSISFMQERFGNKEFIHVEVLAVIFVLLFAGIIAGKKIKESTLLFLPLTAFGLLGFMAVRGIPLFALAVIPAGAYLITYFVQSRGARVKTAVLNFLGGIAVMTVIAGFTMGYSTDKKNKRKNATYSEPAYFSPIKYTTGTGLFPDMNLSAQFFLENNIKGPVFNNYDIGGYLIYHLYGKEKVFVDNRPEAYSVDFFKQTYTPMQENMEKFREVEKKYNFNCIWFYRHDNTPWAQPFLIQLIDQPDYAPVFVDGLTIMFLKRNAQNAELIAKYELPKDMFRSVPG